MRLSAADIQFHFNSFYVIQFSVNYFCIVLAEKQHWDCGRSVCGCVACAHITSSANTDAFFVYLFVCCALLSLLFHSCFHLFSHCHEINVPYFPSMPTNTQQYTTLFQMKAKYFTDTHSHANRDRERQQADCVKQTHAQAMRKTEIIRTNFPSMNLSRMKMKKK